MQGTKSYGKYPQGIICYGNSHKALFLMDITLFLMEIILFLMEIALFC